jgi:protein-disulfide isomerase
MAGYSMGMGMMGRAGTALRAVACATALQFALGVAGLPARAADDAYPLRADYGAAIPNMRVSPELAHAVAQLSDVVAVGAREGGVTIAEFYDLNCVYCRMASVEIAELLRTNPDLRIVLVSFPVLGVASIEAARVELAVRQKLPPERFHEFHLKLYAGRGVVDGARAFAVAKEFGLEAGPLAEVANSDEVTRTMQSHFKLGKALGMNATPSFVVNDVVIDGYPGRKAMEGVVRSLRRCNSVVC